ncbi:MAG: PorT family protein [Sphingobacteriales bacterium]|nr:PorT family protein [Sphingobacteriales bacterium]
MKILLGFLFLLPLHCFSQLGIGVKAGLNFVNVTNTAGINANSKSGYMVGGYISPKPKKIIGYRSELILSRQGYDYKSNTNTGTVNLDYLLLPQLITFNFTKKFEVHVGGQMALLLNAKVDSSGNSSSGTLLDYFNKFDYGVVGGVQVSPVSGLFIGSRINISLHNLNKELPIGGSNPNFVPKELIKNNVVQLYAGWRF